MKTRKLLVAANWKMHSPPHGWDSEDSPYRAREDIDVVVFPTFLDIHTCVEHYLIVGAQYGHPEKQGPFTGDVSIQMLAERGCRYVLCGHSERRHHHRETDTFIAKQVAAAELAGIHPIVCIGETEEQREAGQTEEVIRKQLEHLPGSVTIAYEPVWAISTSGSGKTATAEQAQEVHALIRSLLPGDQRATTRILYGGSVAADNAAHFLAQQDIDGVLVGGASLDPVKFGGIVQAAIEAAQ